MKVMMKFINICVCFTFFGVVILGVSIRNTYTQGLIKYLRRESRLHQVMFIIDDNLFENSSSSANCLITDISKHFPSFSTSITELQIGLQKHFPPSTRPPRRTTLFIMILNGDKDNAWAKVHLTLMQLKQLSQGHSYPKCMINLISHKESHSMKEILSHFWSQGFLDISVLEHSRENEKSLSMEACRVPILYEVNCFRNTFKVQKVRAVTKWFPNKLLNVHRHQILFAFGGHMNEMSRNTKYIRFTQIFSKLMNCSVKTLMTDSLQFNLGHNRLFEDNVEMILNLLQHNIVSNNVTANPLIRIVGFHSLIAVIPIKIKFTNVIVITNEFIYMLLATVFAIVSMGITARILKFNRTTWQTFSISQIIMGLPVTREPQKSTERIVFGILILTCIVYSGYFYSVILDISLKAEPQISNLEELANSSLTPEASSLVKKLLLTSSISYIRKLGKKIDNLSGVNSNFKCLEILTKFANVTCITTERVIMDFKMESDFNGRVMKEPMGYFMLTWLAKDGSPYLDRFNEIILKASEHGLLSEILYRDYEDAHKISSPEEIGKDKLLLIVSYLLIIGYSLASFAFVVEMISVIKWRKINFFCKGCINYFKK